MNRSCLVLLLLNLGLLTTGFPYEGLKGTRRRYQQKTTNVGFIDNHKESEYGNGGEYDIGGGGIGGKDLPSDSSYGNKNVDVKDEAETPPEHGDTVKDTDLGYVSGSDQGKPDLDYVPSENVDKLGPDYSPNLPEQPRDSGLDYVPENVAPHDGKHSDYSPDKAIPDYVPDKDVPHEGTGSDYVPDKDINQEGTGSDYVPDKVVPDYGIGPGYLPPKEKSPEGTGSDYVPYEGTPSDYNPEEAVPREETGVDYFPDKEIPYEGPGSDYVPEEAIPREETGVDYIPDKEIPYEGPGSDYVPDKAIPDFGINSDYLPPKEISPEGTGFDYVPDKVIPHEEAGSDYVPKEVLPHERNDNNYVPDQGIEELDQEVGKGYGTDQKDLYKDPEPEYIPEKGKTHTKGSHYITPETWSEKLKKKWAEFTENTKEVAEEVGRAFHSTVEGIEGHFTELWHKFTKILSNFGYEIQRGARYVFTVISTSVEEVKASQIIEKLEQRLEQGNEIVDEFFQKVGQKMTHWAQQHNHENIDEGLFLETQQSKESNFLDIFQDKEIHTQVEKMVGGGVITQEEADLISQIKHTKLEGGLDGSSYTNPDHHEGSGSYGIIEGTIDQVDQSGGSYGTGGKLDHTPDSSSYDNQDSKQHHTTKKELEGHNVEEHSKGYGRPDHNTDLQAINFPTKKG